MDGHDISASLQSERQIGLVLIGGAHHVLHLVPIAAELDKIAGVHPIVYVTTEAEAQQCAQVLRGLGMDAPDIRRLRAHPLIKFVSSKLSFLFGTLRELRGLDAIITAELTSTILRYVPGRLPLFVRTKHGAGDRAKSYDPRIRHFDLVLIVGPKDRDRMLELGIVREEASLAVGYIKPQALQKLAGPPPALFPNDHPVVIYTPHFDDTLSSLPLYGMDVLDAFARRPDLNLIFAPHMRRFKGSDPAERAPYEAYDTYENIHVDLGSLASTDMSYTRAADIYLGDVSSQVYEFLHARPKPVIYLVPPGTPWRDNPDYANFAYGAVCETVHAVMDALETAQVDHVNYEAAQRAGARAAMGDPEWNAAARAAAAIVSALER